MASVNKIILLGHLGADPETRYMPNGDAVTTIRMATTEAWKDKTTGEKREITEWHRVVFYRKLAEIVSQYVKKGAPLYIEGRIRTRKWQDKDGQDRYATEIEAQEMQMLGSKPQGAGRAPEPPAEGSRRPPASGSTPPGFDEDDIPF